MPGLLSSDRKGEGGTGGGRENGIDRDTTSQKKKTKKTRKGSMNKKNKGRDSEGIREYQ